MSAVYGMLAVFATPDAAAKAAAHLRKSGIAAIEAYTPYPVEALGRILRPDRKLFLPGAMVVAAIAGAAYGYWIQVWGEVIDYPINVGGRPHHSWPAFLVSAFEIMLLVTLAAGLVAMLAASQLPKLHHPTFAASVFQRASRDRFLICVKASDPCFDAGSLRETFGKLGAETVEEVRA